MPPITPSQQNSRAGLITSLVIFVILFVTSTIIAIHFYTLFMAEQQAHKTDITNLNPGVTLSVLANNHEVADVIDEAKKHPPMTGIEWAIQQRNKLAKLITSNQGAPIAAVEADTSRTLEQVRGELKTAAAPVTLGDDNLLADIKTLTGEITALTGALAQAKMDTDTANKTIADNGKAQMAALATKDKEIADKAKEAEDTKAGADARQAEIGGNIATIQKDADAKIAAQAAQTAAIGAELGKAQQEAKKNVEAYTKAVSVLNRYRLNPSRSLLQPAGVITRVPGDNTVYISLGEGQQISPGLTFEIYDRKKGLPSLTTLNAENPDELPSGKASIEVIRVMDSTSECRIIHLAQGEHIVEGDLVLNLVYNTHTRFAFMVYGDFDLANNGQPTPGDADVVRRLITQWGGRVMDQVTVDTDFVVLGKQPTVNPLPDSPTPLDSERYAKQQAALDKYLNIQSEAIHLSIPILNQNRFLYFVGYYDQAKR
jgi:hypothetical protein